MIATTLNSARQRRGEQSFLISDDLQWSYRDLHAEVARWSGALAERDARRMACYLSDSPYLICLMLAAAAAGRSLALFNRDYSSTQVASLVAALDIDLLIVETPLAEDPDSPINLGSAFFFGSKRCIPFVKRWQELCEERPEAP